MLDPKRKHREDDVDDEDILDLPGFGLPDLFGDEEEDDDDSDG